ncbi:glycosyltransferase family 87 protein [Vibrio tasmaniensis]|uniref:glycosyltransferase family 87 protein n=1 Tax=Vibrio tasmaniensis TaxID=212663 RepID=UPI00107F91EB|nr:glycosyltransferase family 87 protein [Vibrio tasmaniensis]
MEFSSVQGRRLIFWFAIGSMLSLYFSYIDTIDLLKGELSRGQMIGRDFLHSWTAAKLAMSGDFSEIYNVNAFLNHAPIAVKESGVAFNFAYSPQMLVVLAPFSYFDYVSAYIIWCLLCVLVFLPTVLIGSKSRLDVVVFIALLAPTTIINITSGQNGLLVAALFVGGCRFLPKFPVLSGVMFGLLTIKPHLGLLIPIALVAGGHWKAILSASLTTIIFVGFSVVLFGISAWESWWREGSLEYAKHFIEEGEGMGILMQVSPFIAIKESFGSVAAAWYIHVGTMLMAVGVVVYAFRTTVDYYIKMFILITATYLVSPYLHNYDMAALTASVLLLLTKYDITTMTQIDVSVIIAVWLIPIVGMYAALYGLYATPLVTVFYIILLTNQILQGDKGWTLKRS